MLVFTKALRLSRVGREMIRKLLKEESCAISLGSFGFGPQRPKSSVPRQAAPQTAKPIRKGGNVPGHYHQKSRISEAPPFVWRLTSMQYSTRTLSIWTLMRYYLSSSTRAFLHIRLRGFELRLFK